jgi:hypothetical protein
MAEAGRVRARLEGNGVFGLLGLLLLTAGLFGSADVCSAQVQAYVQRTEHGAVNWYEGLVRATGVGGLVSNGTEPGNATRTAAVREAKIAARTGLLRTLRSVMVDRDMSVARRMDASKELRETLLGEVHNAHILDRTHLAGDRIEISAGLRLWGRLSRLVIPASVWYQRLDGSETPSVNATGQPSDWLERRRPMRAKSFSGLVIDARNIPVQPALICRISDAEGGLIYGPEVVNPKIAVNEGMAAYVQDIGSALNSQRSGDSPLVLLAEEAGDGNGCHIVLSKEGSKHFQPRPHELDFLRQAHVLIVLGQGSPDTEMTEYRLPQ